MYPVPTVENNVQTGSRTTSEFLPPNSAERTPSWGLQQVFPRDTERFRSARTTPTPLGILHSGIHRPRSLRSPGPPKPATCTGLGAAGYCCTPLQERSASPPAQVLPRSPRHSPAAVASSSKRLLYASSGRPRAVRPLRASVKGPLCGLASVAAPFPAQPSWAMSQIALQGMEISLHSPH